MVRHLIGLTEGDVISSVQVKGLLCLGLLLVASLSELSLLGVLLLLVVLRGRLEAIAVLGDA